MRRLLEDARRQIARGWCQDAWARLADGTSCDVQNPAAVSFCLSGSVSVNSLSVLDYVEAIAYIRTFLPEGISAWNDVEGRTQAEVLAVFDRAIESLS